MQILIGIDLARMIEMEDEYEQPQDLFMRPFAPTLNLFTFPGNITNWLSVWLIMNDLGKVYNARMQVRRNLSRPVVQESELQVRGLRGARMGEPARKTDVTTLSWRTPIPLLQLLGLFDTNRHHTAGRC